MTFPASGALVAGARQPAAPVAVSHVAAVVLVNAVVLCDRIRTARSQNANLNCHRPRSLEGANDFWSMVAVHNDF